MGPFASVVLVDKFDMRLVSSTTYQTHVSLPYLDTVGKRSLHKRIENGQHPLSLFPCRSDLQQGKVAKVTWEGNDTRGGVQGGGAEPPPLRGLIDLTPQRDCSGAKRLT